MIYTKYLILFIILSFSFTVERKISCLEVNNKRLNSWIHVKMVPENETTDVYKFFFVEDFVYSEQIFLNV